MKFGPAVVVTGVVPTQSEPSLRCTMSALHPISQVHWMLAHTSELLHALKPDVDGQQSCPAAPHAHTPEMQFRLELQVVPLQHSSPGPPQLHVPFEQLRFVPHSPPTPASPPQQTSFNAPQASHVPSTHSLLIPHDVEVHVQLPLTHT